MTKLGSDIHAARLRRRISAAIMAERAFITRPTFHKVERREPLVSMGVYATILFVLGLADRIGDLAYVRSDELLTSDHVLIFRCD